MASARTRKTRSIAARGLAAGAALAAVLAAGAAGAQERPLQRSADRARAEAGAPEDYVRLDFTDAELRDVINTIARLTDKNFIYDERVRGRVTIISPTPIPLDQAYAVFESVLQVKGFTTVTTPSGTIKIIPVREAKESSVDTVRTTLPPPNRDHYVTRLIPLRFIDAESIVNTIKPLISKDAAMAAYAPTNTVILTESASNIRRILSILETIDIETYKAELTVIRLQYADANTLARQLSEIYGAEVAAATPTPTRRARRGTTPAPAPTTPGGDVRIITDDRTNSLIVLASRAQLEDVRRLVKKLDLPVTGGGRVHVYYLKHADAEELAQTLNALLSGQPVAPAAPTAAAGQAQALRAAVAGLAEGITLTADPATNSLIIQASQEGFAAISAVIEKLDIARPQVLVEALIMEVDITDASDLGFDGILRLIHGDTDITFQSLTDSQAAQIAAAAMGGPLAGQAIESSFLMNLVRDTREDTDGDGEPDGDGTVISSVIRASAADRGVNIISAPHILTSDNEQAEIRIGNNIPIVSSRVDAARGTAVAVDGDLTPALSTSVNVERQDIGVTLRVTPQITEGDTLRLEIFQEISAINRALIEDTGDPDRVGVPLSNRRIENTVVVADGETVVIGGLIADDYQDIVTKVPWLGDIPFFGWMFKTQSRVLKKTNLLVFLTPHVVRTAEDLQLATIRKREEFRGRSGAALDLSQEEREREEERRRDAEESGLPYQPEPGRNPVRTAVIEHEGRYPLERMREIERSKQEEHERQRAEQAAASAETAPRFVVQAAVFGNESEAMRTLSDLMDAGYDGTLVSGETDGMVLYEIRLGPYKTIDEAQSVGGIVRRSHGLEPYVMVESAGEQ